ncbi:MAG TPA: hypothetical protein VG164_05825 [Trebonia sp.]|nr:hypothetical protein [Trebonia sp.]
MHVCDECGGRFEPKRAHGRFCSGACRVRWFRRNSRAPAEPPADARQAAVDLAMLAGARQAGKITHGQYAAAAVKVISRFATVNDALMALAELANEGLAGRDAECATEHEDVQR